MLAVSVVNAPVPGVTDPIAVAVKLVIAPREVKEDAVTPEASVLPVRPLAGTAAAVMDVLQPKPVLVVQISALAAVLHEPTARSVGLAVPLVALPLTVLVAIVARRALASVPVQTAVMEVAARSAVVGEPPRVRVMFVSSTLVKAAPPEILLAVTAA